MFKFLRKYNKFILAVGGTLLVIVFLIPQAITRLSQSAARSNTTQATLNGENINVLELEKAQNDLQAMNRMGALVPELGAIQDPWRWYLLVHEAREAGLIGNGLVLDNPAQAQLIQDQTGYSLARIEGVFSRLTGVRRLVRLYLQSTPYSDRRLRSTGQQLFDAVEIQSVVIEADADMADLEPTQQAIQAQFDTYADIAVGDPDERFGYRLPDRVRIEWIEITADSIRESIESSDALSGAVLFRHWIENAGTGSVPPIIDPPPTIVPEAVRNDLLNQLAIERTDEIARKARGRLQQPAMALEQNDGYFNLPADWSSKRLSLQTLARDLAASHGIAMPSYRASTEWMDATSLLELAGIGSAASTQFPPRAKSLADIVDQAREFDVKPEDEEDADADAARLARLARRFATIQSGVACPELRGADGSLFFFRIVDTDASRAPTSVAEVRDELVADLKRLRNFDELSRQAGQFEQLAESQNMIALAMEHNTSLQGLKVLSLYDPLQYRIQTLTSRPLTAIATDLPIIGADEDTIKALLKYVSDLPTDKHLATLSEAQRIIALPVEAHLSVVVCRLMRRIPFTEEQYKERAGKSELQSILTLDELDNGKVVADAFAMEALQIRHDFVLLDPVANDPTTQPGRAGAEPVRQASASE